VEANPHEAVRVVQRLERVLDRELPRTAMALVVDRAVDDHMLILTQYGVMDRVMDRTAYLSSLQRDGAALLAAADLGLDADVPGCPGWAVERLVGHVGRVYRTMAGWVRQGAAPTDVPRPPAGPAVRSWTAEALDSLVDAESAHGVAQPVDGALAVDAVDELLDVIMPFRLPDALTGNGETLHLHATDVDGEWLVTLTSGRPTVERTHAKGDVAARGPASDLLLLLWNRADADPSVRERLQVFGDSGLLDRWASSVRI
jgi:hypothetical protein